MVFNCVLTMFLPWFDFEEEAFSSNGHKVVKTCSCENFFGKKYLIIFIIYIIGT